MGESFLLSKVVQRLLACAVAAGALWWAVVHCGPREGTVVLHILEPGLEVTLAGRGEYQPVSNEAQPEFRARGQRILDGSRSHQPP
jgi:hypothetical protein